MNPDPAQLERLPLETEDIAAITAYRADLRKNRDKVRMIVMPFLLLAILMQGFEQQFDWRLAATFVFLGGLLGLVELVVGQRIQRLTRDLAEGVKQRLSGNVKDLHPRIFKKNWMETYAYTIWVGGRGFKLVEEDNRSYGLGDHVEIEFAPHSQHLLSDRKI